jgi:hypothetical protein
MKQLRFAPRGRGRVGPFAVAGFAAGVSRPDVNEVFPTRVTNRARGGGLLVPLGERLTAFADVRMLSGAEGSEGIVTASLNGPPGGASLDLQGSAQRLLARRKPKSL